MPEIVVKIEQNFKRLDGLGGVNEPVICYIITAYLCISGVVSTFSMEPGSARRAFAKRPKLRSEFLNRQLI